MKVELHKGSWRVINSSELGFQTCAGYQTDETPKRVLKPYKVRIRGQLIMTLGDFPTGFGPKYSNARNDLSSSSGDDPGTNETSCANRTSGEHMDIPREDMSNLVVDGAAKKKRVSRIIGGGLRQFSIMVCKKVESKGITMYSEVADEIIAEFAAMHNDKVPLDELDEKNIRRRVYDALNVLIALNIITRDRKEICWKGPPSTSTKDMEDLKAVHAELMRRVGMKAAYLQELEEQIAGHQNLVLRNQQLHESGNVPSQGFSLPFILVQTHPQATVEIEISEDMQLVHFDFNSSPFTLHDDDYILKLMRYYQIPERRCASQSSAVHSSLGSDGVGKSQGTTSFYWNSEIIDTQKRA